MRPDVLTIHRFYESPIGRRAATYIGARMLNFLPHEPGMSVVGLGYALPYLDMYAEAANGPADVRTLAFMPDRQGVCHWPDLSRSRSCLVDPYHLPLADSAVDRVLLVHSLEHAHKPTHLFREVWRVLAPGGQVLVVVPNRMRTWSAAEATPFGHGKPYSKGQLFDLMTDQMLPPDDWCTVLMVPPFQWRATPRLMAMGERMISMLGRNLGGALIVCARKQVYGTLPKSRSRAKTIPVLTHLP